MTVSDLSELPLSLQFWTGGSKKLRGYDYLSIGTGRKLLEGSIQLQHEIWNSLYLGPFYDVGNASDDPFRDIQSSVGMALTWASPVGAIELSAAHALTDRGKSFKIQFSMGPEL
jgi:translocation and assembly module TamA